MILEWFNAQVAVAAGTSLADKFAPPIGSRSVGRAKGKVQRRRQIFAGHPGSPRP
jgi:hypothetical protein